MYQEGRGVDQDDVEAAKWFRRAAEQEHDDGMNNLGWMYQEGCGVEQSDEAALEWYRRAAELGNSAAQNNLGWMYQEGRGVEQDEVKAVEWYAKAAEPKTDPNGKKNPGDAVAQHNLGLLLLEREEPDAEQAMKWFRRAADQDYPPAQFSLGLMYEEGRLGISDMKRATFWYNKAAEFGDPDAEEKLQEMSDEGTE
jgi:TPR repeat protein